MRHFRACYRILFIAVVTILMYIAYVTVRLFLSGLRAGYEPWRNYIMRKWSAWISLVIGLRVHVRGTPPAAPFFLVSNHLSYLDIIPFYRTTRCTFIVKKDVASWPVLGIMVRSMGVLFIDRMRKTDVRRVNSLVSKSLNRDQGVILFPEGTTSPGQDVLPFRASLLEHPAGSDIPVYYATLSYKTSEDDLPADQSVCWWGDISFPAHFYTLAGLKRVDCYLHFGDESVHSFDRKELAERLHAKVQNQFIPVSDEKGLTGYEKQE